MDEAKSTTKITPEMEQVAEQRAKERARTSRWDLDVAVFLFAILIIIIILIYQDIRVEIVAPVAVFGLAMVWLVGWRRGKQLYQQFYREEMSNLKRENTEVEEEVAKETIEERIQKALRERGK